MSTIDGTDDPYSSGLETMVFEPSATSQSETDVSRTSTRRYSLAEREVNSVELDQLVDRPTPAGHLHRAKHALGYPA